MTEPAPVHGRPALIVGDALVVADLHLGWEDEHRTRGFFPPQDPDSAVRSILAIARETGAREVVLLGDVKHPIARGGPEGVVGALAHLAASIPTVLVPGNHDGGLPPIPRLRLAPVGGLVRGGVGLLHGHAWPSEEVARCPVLVLGHLHPHAVFDDPLGPPVIVPVWLRIPAGNAAGGGPPTAFREAIVVPPFQDPGRGAGVNAPDFAPLGPVLRHRVLWDEAQAYTLDGVALGPVQALCRLSPSLGRGHDEGRGRRPDRGGPQRR